MASIEELNITNLKKIAKSLGMKGYSKYRKADKDGLVDEINKLNRDDEVTKIAASLVKDKGELSTKSLILS